MKAKKIERQVLCLLSFICHAVTICLRYQSVNAYHSISNISGLKITENYPEIFYHGKYPPIAYVSITGVSGAFSGQAGPFSSSKPNPI